MYNSVARPSSSIPRPTKRRRRTATAVLAGYFDPQPERDFFTDMANSSDTINPYNSVIGHGPGVLFDLRSQKEKDAESVREQKRLLKNAKRRERDIEKRRDKDEQKIKKAQKRADRIRETAQVKCAQQLEEEKTVEASGASATSFAASLPSAQPMISFTRGAASGAPTGFPEVQSPLQTGSFSGWSPYYIPSQGASTSSHEGPLIYRNHDTSSPAAFRQSTPPLRTGAPLAPSVTISVSHPSSTLLPVSPPTPSRSISSYTSLTSSKRPHTPDDDDGLSTQMQTDDHSEFQAYSSMEVDYDVDIIDTHASKSFQGDKRPRPATSFIRDPPQRNPPSMAASSALSHRSNTPPAWISSHPRTPVTPLSGATQNEPWLAGKSPPFSSADSNRSFPAPENNTSSSTSHRRSALSLSSLLSPIPMLHLPPRPVLAVQPTPENPVTEEAYIPRPIHTVATAEAVADQPPQPPVITALTVESSHLSPLANISPLGRETLSIAEDEIVEEPTKDNFEPSSDDLPLAALSAKTETATEPFDNSESGFQECGELEDLNDTVPQVNDIGDVATQREDSATPEHSMKDKGRASKAMLVIQSEDDLTDLEDLRDPSPSCGLVKEGTKHAGSVSLVPRGVSALQEQSDADDGLSIPGSSASPVASGGNSAPSPRRRKRQAAKKGWKGWIEVEVEVEQPLPPRHFSLDILPPGERRTRSGRHFDG